MIELVDVRLDHPRGGSPMVDAASLAVAPGEIVVVIGAAGVGTSCVAAAALGELPIAAGRIELCGHDIGRLRRGSLRKLRRQVGIVPQDLCLLEQRSAQLNVVLPLEIDGIPRSVSIPRAAELLDQLGLAYHASVPVDCLPASARQRVAVARALVRQPAVVIADHPTSMQDADGAELVCGALAGAAHGGASCLIFGRDPALRAIADREGWRQLALVDGQLRTLSDLGARVDEVLVDIESWQNLAPRPITPIAPAAIPNVLPFPITARTAAR